MQSIQNNLGEQTKFKKISRSCFNHFLGFRHKRMNHILENKNYNSNSEGENVLFHFVKVGFISKSSRFRKNDSLLGCRRIRIF